ncbi:HNH endonuclease [Sphingobacterium sp.]|uniref:HNH endonuclease n=1 Tax=Sphingobacterium sp. TaxID=341027 RepID=UPI0028A7BDC4|nr:HNH endonuclease [Sphingobacterium sp.]
MTQRKSLTKKTRFEVFKRDSFTCQYCGSKAPEVILEVDHIDPVNNGGSNEFLNLITSCFDCNRGKSKTKLSDSTVLDKQRQQIEELNLRRQQLEMMLEWKNELLNVKVDEFSTLMNYIREAAGGFELTEYGEKVIRRLLNTHGFEKSLNALEITFNQYFLNNNLEDFCLVIEKVGGVANVMDKPDYEKRIAYILGILKNRFKWVDVFKAKRLMTNMYNNRLDMEDFKDLEQKAKRCYDIDEFYDYLEFFDYY